MSDATRPAPICSDRLGRSKPADDNGRRRDASGRQLLLARRKPNSLCAAKGIFIPFSRAPGIVIAHECLRAPIDWKDWRAD